MKSTTPEQETARREWIAAVKTAHREKVRFFQRWRVSFENFLEDMGDPPAGAKLIRKDRKGPFTPENCQWRT